MNDGKRIPSGGVFLVDKPAGYSSAKVVAIVKRRFSLRKVGHAGTLDPAATGLLVLLVDDATKLASRFESGRKVYSGTFRFGRSTTTDDAEGTTIAEAAPPAAEAVRAAAAKWRGVVEQVPPAVSAVKINGERAYRRVRRGEEIVIAPRSVEIYGFDIAVTPDPALFSYRVECSKGTYIRSLARDIGAELSCGGIVETLRRESSYPFEVCNARPLDALLERDMIPIAELARNQEAERSALLTVSGGQHG